MIDINKLLIDYGYLQREIGDVMAYACAGNDKDVVLLKINNEELSIIAKKIRELKSRIKELEEQLTEKDITITEKEMNEQMDAKQFFQKVTKMREMQKLYFKTRHGSYLTKSKALEKEIDKEIERVNKVKNRKQNPRLFK